MNKFIYGQCDTDTKSGNKLKRLQDFMRDDDCKSFVQQTLFDYGLPEPDIKSDVFRGTHHDLLFLDSHGIVIRIGETNIKDLVNPAILQPLHWRTDPKSKVTVALYPGIEARGDENKHTNIILTDIDGGRYQEILKKFGNQTIDAWHHSNRGLVRVFNEQKQETSLDILLDMDNTWNFTLSSKPYIATAVQDYPSLKNTLHKVYQDVVNDLTEKITKFPDLKKYYELPVDPALYLQAFKFHEPLRHAFHQAFKNNTINERARDLAWEMALNYHTQGYKIYKKEPHAQTRKLYSPWTKPIT